MRRLIAILKTVDRAIAAVELVAALAALAGMLVLTTIPIVLRTAGGNASSFWWTTPTSLYLLLTATFFGASLAARARRHIQIDLVTRALPRRVKAGFGVVGGLVAAVILGFLAYAAIHYVRQNWDQSSKLRGLALGPLQLGMPVALWTMTFRFVLGALEDLVGVVTGDLSYLAYYEHVEGQAAVEHRPVEGEPPPPPPEEPLS